MKNAATVEPSTTAAKRPNARGLPPVWHASAIAVAATLCVPQPAQALDGCLVLLCLAAPNWRAIPQCVPPITQLLHDLAHGHPFPTCAMAGPGNSATHQWASAPGNCPPQYTRANETESATVYSCDYAGVFTLTIDGELWGRTWWSMGDSVTDYAPAARAKLGTWDTRFDDDYAAWQARQPAPAPEDRP
jgi:hypothetical protein